jgi:hypothetical protein
VRIPPLPLPSRLPSDSALISCKQNKYNYDPEFWEMEYEGYRYLEQASPYKVVRRYHDIVNNLLRLVGRSRDIIPINSFLSSWYWYKKEHQNRLELYIRDIKPIIGLPNEVPNSDSFDVPTWPKHPNSCDVLYRFDESRWINPFMEKGNVRIGLASRHLLGKPEDPRTDNEIQKDSFMAGKYTKISTQAGVNIPIIGDVRYSTSGNDYYDLCMSCGYNRDLFLDFKADACFVIKQPEIFAGRISNAAKQFLPKYDFFHGPIQYYDPYNLGKNEFFDPYLSKNFSYAYQMEYRFIWFTKENIRTDNFIYLDVGSLKDIVYIHKL